YALVLFLLFSPVVHPWYGLWFAPLLAFFPASSAIYLALTLPVAYYGLLAGDSVDIPVLVKLFEFAPCYALLVFEIARILKGAPHWRRGL
ncbi:MAG: hypothetical protein KDD53_09650, partial [Bdellovibrionales bacterium]|nr:hypothetical protein [Bdellovibrionales bacterium]